MNDVKITMAQALAGMTETWREAAALSRRDREGDERLEANEDIAVATTLDTCAEQIELLLTTAATDPARMAPPAPDVSRNAGYTIRAVLPGHPAMAGLLESWWVAAEDAERSQWVTWEAYRMDGSQEGRLAYNAGTYFHGPDQSDNKRRALADLAIRAGAMRAMAERIAGEMISGPDVTAETRRAARGLRRWAA
jgi:hypothetical protein